MIKAVIIEDEPLTANRLKRLVGQVRSDVTIVAMLQTVKETLEWLSDNNEPDLYFMDIQLSDGLSFDIFSAFSIKKPVIFTTAFDEYAIKAFKANGIDYLLKPVAVEDIEKSLNRYSQFNISQPVANLEDILKGITNQNLAYKSNFLVEYRDQLFSVPASEIAYFQLSNKMMHMVTNDRKIHIINSSLDFWKKRLTLKFFSALIDNLLYQETVSKKFIFISVTDLSFLSILPQKMMHLLAGTECRNLKLGLTVNTHI